MTVYLDHAASTPLRPEAREAWLEAQVAGNPSSVHAEGQRARRLLEDARERLARVLGCEPIEVVLTSGGTESANLALTGLWGARRQGRDAIVLPDGEHHAVIEPVDHLAREESADVRAVVLDAEGRILPERLADALAPGDAALATALVANNEVGTLQDADALARVAAEAHTPLHLDAVAALGHAPVDFARWRGDAPGGSGLVAMSISGHKIGAPAGTGALVVSRTAALAPLLRGGGQQRALRAGTQDVAGAMALATAAELAEAEREEAGVRHAALRERLLARLARRAPRIRALGDPVRRVSANVHLLLPGAEGESVLFLLDVAGVAASTGSACQAGVAQASHVVRAMGFSETEARQVLRITMGRDTTEADVDRAADAIADACARLTG
ncbi:cysteine desulfurase family protein [Microbacterium sp. gxy059]|uniref:cysteine desulfurase family protein n=1 Tax=Microbacterium sp. gxy059 TaxID=2957199 RepID=UPI003D995BA2